VSFESEGLTFDPEQHEAVDQKHSNKIKKGDVVNEVQRGFFVGGRLLCLSLVTVLLGPSPSYKN